MPKSKNSFNKKLKDAVAKLNKTKARFDSAIKDQSTPQLVVSIKEELDNEFDCVCNLCIRRDESLVESARNNKEKCSVRAKVSNIDSDKVQYDEKYTAYMQAFTKLSPSAPIVTDPPPTVPVDIKPVLTNPFAGLKEDKSMSGLSQSSTTSSIRAKLQKDLALKQLQAQAELQELENQRKQAEIQRQMKLAEIQFNYDLAIARSNSSKSSKGSVSSVKVKAPPVTTTKQDEDKSPPVVNVKKEDEINLPPAVNVVKQEEKPLSEVKDTVSVPPHSEQTHAVPASSHPPAVPISSHPPAVPTSSQPPADETESFEQFITRYDQSSNRDHVLQQDYDKHHSTPHPPRVNFDLSDNHGNSSFSNDNTMALLLRSCSENPPDKKYDGSALDFFMFIKNFEDTTLRLWSHDPRYGLQRLMDSVDTRVYESIKWCYTIDDKQQALITALDTLKSLYGDVNVIERAHIDNVINGEPLRDNHESLFEFLIKLRNCKTVVLASNPAMKYGKSELMTGAFMRLPRYLKTKLNELLVKRHTKFSDVDLLSMLIEVLDKRIKYHASFLGKLIADDSKKKSSKFKSQQINVNSSITTFNTKHGKDNGHNDKRKKTLKPCPVCSSTDHSTSKCNVFTKDMNLSQRIELVSQKALCKNCLKPGHQVVNCWSRFRCKNCTEKHHTYICPKPPNTASINACDVIVSECDTNANNLHVNNACSHDVINQHEPNVEFQLLNVRVWNKHHSEYENAIALMDGGSNVSLCTERLYDKLGLTGKEANVCMKTLDGAVRDITTKRTSFNIKGNQLSTATKRLNNVLVVQSLPDLCRSKFGTEPPMFEGLPNFPTITGPCDIDILIGACDADMHIMLEVRQAINNPHLYAIKLPLGWTKFGCNSTLPINLPSYSNDDMNVNCARITNADLHELIEKVFNIDCYDSHDSYKNATSINDDIASNIVESSIRKVDGQYEIAMPFKPEITSLPNNYVMAYQHLMSLTKRLLKGPEIYATLYNNAIEELLKLKQALPVDTSVPTSPLTWYLPHFYVVTCDKFRMVYNPSATFCGFSLNSSLFSGPDINNTLLGVLLRFRQYAFAFVADIQKMFLQVKIPEHQQDSLRFLWWKDGVLGGEVETNKMACWPFGIGPAPYCTGIAVLKTAADNEPGVPQSVCNIVKRNRYVDDILKAAFIESVLVSEALQLITLFKSGGFTLRKFMSNSKLLLSKLPLELLATSMKEIALHGLPVKAVLGIAWDAENDNFVVRINSKSKPHTRRGLLSQIGEMFDPLGMLGPFILPMKILLQELQVLSFNWDDEVPLKIFKVWKRWLESLRQLEKLALPRAYCYHSDFNSVELHCFSDASTKGYASVCYLRFCYNDHFLVSFVLAKCKVVPKRKGITMPRLELMAAVVSVRLTGVIIHELDSDIVSKIKSKTFWSDSTTVLKFIANSDARYKLFVANRVKYIREHTETKSWRYVPTKLNTGDTGSRGVMPHEMEKIDVWFNGPKFLLLEEKFWDQYLTPPPPPTTEVIVSELIVEDVKSNVKPPGPLVELVQRHSTWNRLRKTVSWLVRFKRWFIASKVNKEDKKEVSSLQTDPISVLELEQATVDICLIVQQHAFPGFSASVKAVGFLDAIQKYPTFGKLQCQSLRKLHPFVSNDGLLRVGGRIHNSRFSDEVKHPIILPSHHHVTGLIVNHEHQKYAHFGGYRYVLGRVRTNYWIIHGASAIKHYLKSCRLCQQLKATPLEQVIAPLPADRLLPGRKVFHAAACDYFGPIPVLVKRSVVKRWCCLFTCLAIRAIHIEVVFSLSTDSFIKAYLRFLYLVGFSVQTLYSDNASCFYGANVELREALAKLDHSKIHSSLRAHGVNWIFNPPAASHQGGVFERQIRSVRKIFRVRQVQSLNSKFNKVINQSTARLDDEDLLTLVREAQTIVNARPITPASDNPDDFAAITPLMLMTGCISPEPPLGEFSSKDELRKSWKRTQSLADKFWEIWVADYIPSLQKAQKWHKPARNLQPGDLVLFRSDEIPKRRMYPLAVVESVDFNSDGYVRRAHVRVSDGRRFYRDIRKLSLLEAAD